MKVKLKVLIKNGVDHMFQYGSNDGLSALPFKVDT